MGIITITNPDGSVFTGNAENGIPQGVGSTVNRDGSGYDGEYLDGKPNGKGKMTFRDGTVLEGAFKDGVFCGEGKKKYKNGLSVLGSFRDGEPVGVLTLDYQRQRYIGRLYKNLYHGRGEIYLANGDHLVGSFRFGRIFGIGKYYFKDGGLLICRFRSRRFSANEKISPTDLFVYGKGRFEDGEKRFIGRVYGDISSPFGKGFFITAEGKIKDKRSLL